MIRNGKPGFGSKGLDAALRAEAAWLLDQAGSPCVNGAESSPVAFIGGLYVTPALRRHGVARRLVSRAAEWAAKHDLQRQRRGGADECWRQVIG